MYHSLPDSHVASSSLCKAASLSADDAGIVAEPGAASSYFELRKAKLRLGQYSGDDFLEDIASYRAENNWRSRVPVHRNNGNGADFFLDELLGIDASPDEIRASAERPVLNETICYVPLCVDYVLDMLGKLKVCGKVPDSSDTFYDIGSGVGRITALFNILTEAKSIGVEYQPTFCETSRKVIRDLNLTNVSVIESDARNVDYRGGTIFYLWQPFHGEVMKEVAQLIDRVALEAKGKEPIWVCYAG
jgi:hypothetical protein